MKLELRTAGVLSVISLAMSVASVWAAPVDVQRSLTSDQQAYELAQLEAKRDRVSRRALAPNAKGPLLVRYMDKHAQLQDLIDRIQSGQSVSPDEIDQALQPTNP